MIKGSHITEEHKRRIKIANAKKGILFKKGYTPWLKGKTAETDSRIISGSKHYNWNGGVNNSTSGYRRFLMPKHPNADSNGYISEHVIVMEKHLGRYLKKGEIVHHIDENRKNNNLKNLKLCLGNTEHKKFHNKSGIDWSTKEGKNKYSREYKKRWRIIRWTK